MSVLFAIITASIEHGLTLLTTVRVIFFLSFFPTYSFPCSFFVFPSFSQTTSSLSQIVVKFATANGKQSAIFRPINVVWVQVNWCELRNCESTTNKNKNHMNNLAKMSYHTHTHTAYLINGNSPAPNYAIITIKTDVCKISKLVE